MAERVDFFKAFGDSTVHLMSRFGTPEQLTLEDLYQAIKDRLIVELVVSAPDLSTMGILQPSTPLQHPSTRPSSVEGGEAQAGQLPDLPSSIEYLVRHFPGDRAAILEWGRACQGAHGVPACVTPKNDNDALLIDNLFRACLGRDSAAIDTARMELRRRMNELRSLGVATCQAPEGRCDQEHHCCDLNRCAYGVALPVHPNLKGLAAALRSQRQVDEDGTEVGVSRQAADEAAAIIEALDRARGVKEARDAG